MIVYRLLSNKEIYTTQYYKYWCTIIDNKIQNSKRKRTNKTQPYKYWIMIIDNTAENQSTESTESRTYK